MTSRWLIDPRGRALAALATLLSLGACPIANPDFDTSADPTGDAGGGASTGAATSTSTSASATTEPASGAGVTGTAETSATATTLPTSTTDPGTTTDGVTTGGTTEPGTTGTTGNACDAPNAYLDVKIANDAFFISGGTDAQTTCNYYQAIAHPEFPCRAINFGTTGALQLARMDGGIDAMYAARFSHEALQTLIDQGAVFFHAELMLTVYGQVTKDLELRVGMIEEEWIEGTKDGDVGTEGDSSFESRSIGFQAIPWTSADGPRGASSQVSTLVVPLGYADHSVLTSKPFTIQKWIDDPMLNHGLVVSFPKGVPPTLLGPGIKAKESPYPPVLRVHHCIP